MMGTARREAAGGRAGRARHGAGEGQDEEAEDEEIRQNGCANGGVNGGVDGSSSVQGGGGQQQPGPVIRWERFLPVKTLKVLLVESDDSTRHVVAALLHNCSYEVITAANGIQAWKILEDLTNHIDIVLTEVSMPSSGIGLLSKIMNHKTCKNIPVIMMSSNDSMGTVFKCLSKGAVDFLVKPIRKNELKNLWQHVWKRCHSSSGSGSESGIQTGKQNKSKSADESDNNTGSNDDNDDIRSVDPNARDGSDCSGTQSSWTKHAVEADSPQPSPSKQLGDPPDSTCAQVIHPKPEIHGNEWLPMTSATNCVKQKEFHDDLMGKDLKIGVPLNMSTDYEAQPSYRAAVDPNDLNSKKLSERNINNEAATELDGSDSFEDPTVQAADLIGSIANTMDTEPPALVPNSFSKVTDGKDRKYAGLVDVPSLELSLKRLRSSREGATPVQDERNVLRRSDQSAFTRYHTSGASTQGQTGCAGSCSPLDNSSEAVKTDSTQNMKSNSNAAQIKQGSNGSSNNNDMGSTTKNVFSKPVASKEKVSSPSAVKNSQHISAFHPVQFRPSAAPAAVQEKVDDDGSAGTATGQHQLQVQHHYHHYHHHHHHVHCMQQQQQQQQQSLVDQKSSAKNMAVAAPQCGSSNAFAVEGQAANYSLNESNSGSNPGSNGHNGSTTSANAGGMNTESAMVDNSGDGGGGNGTASGSGSGVYQNRLAQREAALHKFRQKRKERNFGKKVRYQSRKRLAEQRPRVRGQFVRQPANDQAGQGERKHPS